MVKSMEEENILIKKGIFMMVNVNLKKELEMLADFEVEYEMRGKKQVQ